MTQTEHTTQTEQPLRKYEISLMDESSYNRLMIGGGGPTIQCTILAHSPGEAIRLAKRPGYVVLDTESSLMRDIRRAELQAEIDELEILLRKKQAELRRI